MFKPVTLERLFGETPAELRRLAKVLYLVLGPLFALGILLDAAPDLRLWGLAGLGALVGSGAAMLRWRRELGRLSWCYLAGVVPPLSAGLGLVVTHGDGLAFLLVLGAASAYAAVLMDGRVVLVALATSVAVCFFALWPRVGLVASLLDTALFGLVFGGVVLVSLLKGRTLRNARRQMRLIAEQDRAILDAIPDVVARLDAFGNFLDVHAPLGSTLITPAAELVRGSLYDVLAPEHVEPCRAAITRALETGELQQVEFQLVLHGPQTWFEGRITRGMPGEVIFIRRDTTAQHRAQERQRLFGTLIESMQDAVIAADLDLRITSWSPGAQRLFGWTAEEALGRSLGSLQQPAPTSDQERALRERLLAGEDLRRVVRGARKHGDAVTLDIASAVLRDERGAPTGLLEVARDVSELEAAREAATSASELKSRFLANMSHEIRTPLNSVLGLTRLGLEEQSLERVHEYLQIVHRSGQGLLALVNDILDFSKVEAGKLTFEARPFELDVLLDDLLQIFGPAAEAKGLGLGLTRRPGVPAVLVGDALRVRQVLNNLISNALKFTAAGRVELEVGPRDAGLEFRVSDSGIGISEAELARLFHVFTQADASTTRRYGGTGLGLAISRALAEAMGGTLEAQARPGQGSTFVFVCPLPEASAEQVQALRRSEAAASHGQAPASLEGKRVLLAEDNKVNQFLARILLEKAGMRVTLAENGVQAVAAARGAHFDAVLMDIQMPELDGLAATRAILAELGRAAPPIIAMTAHAMDEQRQDSLRAGMVAHLTKPIDVAALYATLASVLER